MVRNCLRCNNEFKTYPSQIKLGWGKYCSVSCGSSHAPKPKRTDEGWRKKRSIKRKGEWRFKDRAREAVTRALKTGLLVKAPCCNYCERKVRLDAHHFDYTKPYDVIWLCRKCHLKEHRNK